MTDPSSPKAPTVRWAIDAMQPYSPPTSGRAGMLRLDFNENTRGCSPKVIEKLRELATADFLTVYPEYEAARSEMAAFYGVSSDQLTFSDGTDEGIHVMLQTFVEPGDEVVIPTPAFPMFKFYSQIADSTPVVVPYPESDLCFPIAALLAAITPRTRAVIIANPNNPTGTAVDLATIERILQEASGAAVLVDEAYYEFYGVTALDLLPRYPNLFVSRTFSKTYGLAGLRIGCLFSQAQNMAAIRKGQSPYSVTSVGIVAALTAIKDQDYLKAYVGEVLEARVQLYAAFERLGIETFSSEANFILARFKDDSLEQRVYSELKEKGILVRPRGKEIARCIRFTVGDLEQTSQLIAALREILAS
jgi:histidinol-phosphate aminotransferase